MLYTRALQSSRIAWGAWAGPTILPNQDNNHTISHADQRFISKSGNPDSPATSRPAHELLASPLSPAIDCHHLRWSPDLVPIFSYRRRRAEALAAKLTHRGRGHRRSAAAPERCCPQSKRPPSASTEQYIPLLSPSLPVPTAFPATFPEPPRTETRAIGCRFAARARPNACGHTEVRSSARTPESEHVPNCIEQPGGSVPAEEYIAQGGCSDVLQLSNNALMAVPVSHTTSFGVHHKSSTSEYI